MVSGQRIGSASLSLVLSVFLAAGLAQTLWAGAARVQTQSVEVDSSSPAAVVSGGSDPSQLDMEAIIQSFVEKETEFSRARENYTYRRSIKVHELSMDGGILGTYQIDADIIFSPTGRRTEKVVYAPLSTLPGLSISPEDERDMSEVLPFVMTTAEMQKYNIRYQGRQKLDELDTYVFRIGPKKIEEGERYFDGMAWVDERDLQIVKTYGKAVPDIRKNGQENLFPRFETYREQIDGKYWFPTWTGADDTLYFSSGAKRIKIIVKYENYKQFGTDLQITYGDEAPPPDDEQ